MKFRWRYLRLFLGLLAYWIIATGGAGVIARVGPQGPGLGSLESGYITMVMLGLVVLCMAKERGQWRAWKRILFVPLAWIVMLILSTPALLTVGAVLHAGGNDHLVERGTTFAASLPGVLFAMRRSRLFVALQHEVHKAVSGVSVDA